MKRVILSGYSGYFGALAKKYLEDLGYDIVTAGRNTESDLQFRLDAPEAFANATVDDCDVFIHAAAVNEVVCVENPSQAILCNVAGTRAALDFCVKNGIKKFIYISTFHVYGKDSGVIDEQTKTEPLHDYGQTHLQAEEYVRMYTRKGLVKGVSLRPSNMFDVPVDLDSFNRWSLIPFAFCKSAICDGKIELKTAGVQERNFVSVRDIVSVIQSVILSELDTEIVNISGRENISIKDFALRVRAHCSEELEKNIDVIAPAGEQSAISLSYTSHLIDSQKFISSSIDDFIKNMLSAIWEKKDRQC